MKTTQCHPRMESVQHPFLKSLPPAMQSVLLECAEPARCAAGEIIFRQGDPANRFYLIEDGYVALEACSHGHDPVPVQTLESGSALGWSWLFEPFTWNFQARAIGPVKLLAIDAGHLLRLSNEDHEFGYELMKRIARIAIGRLQSARRRLVELTPSAGSPHPTPA